MKTARTFKGSWFMFSIVVAIVVGEFIAWQISNSYGLRVNPVVVGFVSAALVVAIASVLYDGCDIA
jgi:hypothetical protein